MAFILTSAFLLSINLPGSLLKYTTQLSTYFHEKCVQTIPTHTQHANSLASLVCGAKITDENLKENLSKTSLIHIFVISGSHLILLDEILSIFKIPFFLRFIFLFSYSLISGWQAPAVRALMGVLTRTFLNHFGFFIPSDLKVLVCGLWILFLFPDWWGSLSLQMSWCAALALTTTTVFRIKNRWQRVLFTQFSIYVFMMAPLWGLGSLHPLSIIYNLMLGPIVALILLPLACLTIIFNPLIPVFEITMTFFNELLSKISEPIVLHKITLPSVSLVWLWILFLHLLLHFTRVAKWQGND